MDKRNKKKRNKCLCWGLCLCIVAVAVIIGILAAVGIIGNQGPHPVEEVSARHFGNSPIESEIKAGGIFGLPKDATAETTIPPEVQTPRLTPSPPIVTVSSMLPTTETSMIQVPQALESQFVIDNLQFNPSLSDKNSTDYQKLAQALETEIKNSLFSRNVLNYGAADIEVKVMDFTSGSVVVKYRITWVFKDGIHNAKDPIDEEILKRKMRGMLEKNNGFLDSYHIVSDTVSAERILDLCKIENNGCEHNCSFDYNAADFICSCPEGKYLGPDRKSCVDEPKLDLDHVDFDEVHPDLTEPEPINHHHVETTPHPEPAPAPEPEPTSEPEPKPTEQSHEPTAEPPSSPEPEPTHQPQVVSHENYMYYHPVQEASTPEPTSEPSAEPTPEPNTEPKAEPGTEPKAEPTPEPNAEPKAEPTPEPNAEPKAEPTPEPNAEPSPEPNAEPTPEPKAEPNAEPTPEPTLLHELNTTQNVEPSEPIIATTTKPDNNLLSVEPLAEPTSEPTSEDNTESAPEPIPDSVNDHIHKLVVPEHNTEPIAEPTAEPTSEPVAEPTAEPTVEPVAEPTTEPTSNSESKIESTIHHEVHVGHVPETTAEPSPEIITSVPETTTKSNSVFSHETTSEPVTTVSFTDSSREAKSSSPTTFSPYVVDNTFRQNRLSDEPLPETTMMPSSDENVTSTSESNLIPLAINENTRLVYVPNVTNSTETETTTIPLIFNNQTVTLQPGNLEIKNVSMEPNTIETTTSSSDMTKIFTEIHKVMENQYDQSTEIVNASNTNNTHMNIAVVESTENISALDNMSPFLPEIDNDTFVNKLHLGEHIIPHVHSNDTHEEDANETSPPPSLEKDQMNVTNPKDPNPVDVSLKVVPLEGKNENEIIDKLITTTESPANQETNHMDSHIIPVIIQHESTTAESSSSSVSAVESSDSETTIKPLEENTKAILPSEIINNVHSNNYFDSFEEKQGQKEEITKNNDTTVDTNFSTSTEDLIALETTTNGLKVIENKNNEEITTEVAKKNETGTTIHAEVVETVTESVILDNDKDSSMEHSELIKNETATPEPIVTTPSMHQYEVEETIADVTTTEKLFVPTKVTTESPVVSNHEHEDLSVVPLESDDKDTPKAEEKRVAHDSNLNHLESDTNDKTNDISEEDQNVLSKYDDFKQVHSGNHPDSTTLKETDVDVNTELPKYEGKLNKKSYLEKEKSKYDKKVKLEKVITTVTNDEILTSSAQNDNQSKPFSDIKPVTEDFTISGFSRCLDGQFQCINGTSVKDGNYCIPKNDRCDSVDDCSDASDEIDCVKDGCPNNFQCASGQCLKRHLVCDGIQNCNDGSDETGCEQWTCILDEFSCGQGQRCLPNSWKCDNRRQCPNGSDEYNCPTSTCDDNSFHCLEQNTCVPKSWRCDGKSDCMNAEDEKSCECTEEEFKCTTGGGCIKDEHRCDGIVHCADRSDEWNCFRLDDQSGTTKYLQIEACNNTWHPVCSENWNQTHSDLVCRNLGYSASSLTENVNKPVELKFEEYFKLKPTLTYGSPILSELEKTDTCDSFVSITCQDFVCGSHSTLDVQSARIIGGNRGVETQWPGLALLYNKKRNLQCTATIVTPLWVIASHSCIFEGTSVQPKDWILYAGSTNFFSTTDNSTTQIGQVKNILPHPQAKYIQFEFSNDVVLVELTKPLTMTRNVSAVCLPDKDIEPRQLCVIAGWGVSKPGEANKNQYLHYLPVPIVDAQDCNSTKHYNGLMSKDKICAGYTDAEKTPCYNDEGAPLMCFSDSAGTWELQGVLSHHDNCARSKHPAIYTSINTKIRQWVINTIGQKPARSA